jgi:hypothetical protein
MFFPGQLSISIFDQNEKDTAEKTKDPTLQFFPGAINAFVFDLLSSAVVKNFQSYDYQRISHDVFRYYNGEINFAADVDYV